MTERSSTRRRMVEWEDPSRARAGLGPLPGTEILRRIKSGALAPPPIARVIGFDVGEVEEGRVSFTLTPREDLENAAGMLHGGVAATLLDTAIGAAVHSRLDPGAAFVTLDLKVTFMRPIRVGTGEVVAEGRLLHLGGRTACAEGDIRDADGALCAHGVGGFSIIPPPS